jgi:hypothetical protein
MPYSVNLGAYDSSLGNIDFILGGVTARGTIALNSVTVLGSVGDPTYPITPTSCYVQIYRKLSLGGININDQNLKQPCRNTSANIYANGVLKASPGLSSAPMYISGAYTVVQLTGLTGSNQNIQVYGVSPEGTSASAVSVSLTLPPVAPSNLQVTNITAGGLTLSWSSVTCDSYEIVCTGGLFNNSTIVNGLPSTTTSYTWAAYFTGHKQYTFRVRSVNSAGGTLSNSITMTTGDPVSPLAPTIVSKTNTSVSLSLNSPIGASGFAIYTNGGNRIVSYSINVTISNLSPDTQYSFTATTLAGENNEWESSPPSPATLVTTNPPPSAPNITGITSITTNSFVVNWLASNDTTKYEIYKDGAKAGEVNHPTTTFTVTGLTPGTSYDIFVRATGNGISTDSDPVIAITDVGGTPTSTSPANDLVPHALPFNITATTVSGAVAYDIEVASDSAFSNKITAACQTGLTSPTLQLTDAMGLAKGNKYYWHIRAIYDAVTGNWSPTYSFLVALDVVTLISPENNATGVDAATVVLDWSTASYQAEPGDLAIVRVNSSSFPIAGSFTMVALKNIASTDILKWADNGWYSAGGFRAGENASIQITHGDIPAGTLVEVTCGTALSISGEQVFVFAGDALATNPIAVQFLYGINWANTTGWTDATSANTSALPSTLADAHTFLSGTNTAWKYNGTMSGTKEQLLAAIHNPANWVSYTNATANNVWTGGNFSVTAPTSSLNYAWQLDTTNTFDSGSLIEATTNEMTVDLAAAGLQNGARYYWRVRSYTNDVVGDWQNPAWTFLTIAPMGPMKKVMVGQYIGNIPMHESFSGDDVLVDPLGNSLAAPVIASNNLSDVADVVAARSNLGIVNDFGVFVALTPNPSQVVFAHKNRMATAMQVMFTSMAGAVVKTNPSQAITFNATVDGSIVATITVNTNGAITAPASNYSLEAGKTIKIVAPSNSYGMQDLALTIPVSY